jgi:DNA-binding transcriptional LysR family regulator
MLMTHIDRVDLNLISPLAALLEERHVSHAADLAGMSQPAMSRALQRLRNTLDDELLVRTPSGYQLTPRGERVQRRLTAILPQLENLFAPESFDPAEAAEAFQLAGTDYASSVFGPAVFQRVFRASPNSTLRFRSWGDAIFEDLDHGRVDLIFYAASEPPPALRTEHLFDDEFVCVMAHDHRLADQSELTLDQYLDATHVIIDTGDGGQTLIEERLKRLGTARKAGLTVPYHAAAAPAVAGTSLIATLPSRLLAASGPDPWLRVAPSPEEVRALRYQMSWHPRLEDDPAQRWLRDTVRTVTSALPPLLAAP